MVSAFAPGIMTTRRPQQYDLSTAVTFLLAGLGIGSLLTILLVPHAKSVPESSPFR
jgi:hypothetical protein